jgi:hypothetical protein
MIGPFVTNQSHLDHLSPRLHENAACCGYNRWVGRRLLSNRMISESEFDYSRVPLCLRIAMAC